MSRQRDNLEEMHFGCVDPGRVLLHASLYVWQQARQFPLEAWLDAEEILRRARNEFEDEDRIGFVERIEQQRVGELKVVVLQ
jgi:hypothetical protein